MDTRMSRIFLITLSICFRKSDMTRGLNEDKLKSMKKGPRTRTLKNTKTWKLHQRLPTQELQNVSKNEKA